MRHTWNFFITITATIVLFILGSSESASKKKSKTPSRAKHVESSREFLSDKVFPDKDIQRIGFGSCNKPKLSQDFWSVILEKKPDIMLLLGDNHYAESVKPKKLKEAYNELFSITDFMKLRETCPTFPTWDNHDYGAGYLGRLHPHAEASENLFLNHFQIPKDDVRRKRTGIYGAWTFGKENRRVQVIMLDTMRHRDPLAKNAKKRSFPSNDDPKASILGAEQWAWLKEQLQQEADVRIIGSSIQVLSNEHLWRRWGMFSHERERLLKLIGETSGTTVLLSGDRHRGELSALNPTGKKPLFDITASSFNHGVPAEEKNSLRIGKLIGATHFGWMEIDWEKSIITTQLLSSKNAKVLLSHPIKIQK